jgi:hypothetical protein
VVSVALPARLLAERFRAAYHEAGHAVQCVLEDGDVRAVHLVVRDPGAGACETVCSSSPTVSLAGPAAEQVYLERCGEPLGECDPMWGADWENAAQNLVAIGRDPSDLAGILTRLRTELCRHWRAVEALAEALLKRGFLSGHEVRAIVTEHLDADTRRKLHDPLEDGWRGGYL